MNPGFLLMVATLNLLDSKLFGVNNLEPSSKELELTPKIPDKLKEHSNHDALNDFVIYES